MKVIQVIIIQLLFMNFAYSQSIDIEVQASAGNSFKDQHISVDWTLGEPVTEYVSDNNNSLSNGFQQTIDIIDNCAGYCHTLSGLAHIGASYLQDGTVLIVDYSNLSVIDSVTVENGSFILEQIPPGQYIFLAKPHGADAGQFNPTYYVNKLDVAKANPITVDIYDIGSIDIYLVKVSAPVYSPENKVFSALVYPNPAFDKLYIQSINLIEAGIFDLSERQLLKFSKINGCIDISSLKAGIYAVHLRFQDKTFIQKFIKQ